MRVQKRRKCAMPVLWNVVRKIAGNLLKHIKSAWERWDSTSKLDNYLMDRIVSRIKNLDMNTCETDASRCNLLQYYVMLAEMYYTCVWLFMGDGGAVWKLESSVLVMLLIWSSISVWLIAFVIAFVERNQIYYLAELVYNHVVTKFEKLARMIQNDPQRSTSTSKTTQNYPKLPKLVYLYFIIRLSVYGSL